VHEVADGDVRTFTLDPLDLGIARAAPEKLVGGDASTNARAVHAVLAGESGPHRDITLLNAAAALVVAGIAADFTAGLDAAAASIDAGNAARALDTLLRVSNDAKASET
jgi:anthranilate phosphoribosyltransferase